MGVRTIHPVEGLDDPQGARKGGTPSMSGRHSKPDQWGRKTDADGNVTSISGTLSDNIRKEAK